MSARLVIVLAAIAGCTWGAAPAPQLSGVQPAASLRGVALNVTLDGEGFGAEAVVDFDSPSESAVCGGLRVELRTPGREPIPLERVRIVTPTQLSAHLGGSAYASALVARWDVVVIDAAGTEAVLPRAFEVQNCGTPSVPCDDGEPDCTSSDACTGAARCGGTPVADGAPCGFACPGGSAVPGSCLAGVCVPAPGTCESSPACTP
jgi:hypothetical protein